MALAAKTRVRVRMVPATIARRGGNMPIVLRTAFAALAFAALPAFAGTFVYVSNADDGDIGVYTLQADGQLSAGARVTAAKVVMPMAVSPDRKHLYAGARSKPYSVITYAIDAKTGALRQVATAPLAESFPYISTDRTGRFLFG